MNRRPLLPVIAGAALVIACNRDAVAPPPNTAPAFNINSPPPAARDVTVMSQNLYVGADLDLLIAALASPDPNDDVPALLFAIETLRKTDFPARAEAIADEIARARPHAVGMQEVDKIDVDLRGFGLQIVVQQDFLALLEGALARRGLHYSVAAQNPNFLAAPIPGASLADFDVLLVDDDRVTVTAAGGQKYTNNVGEVAPGVTLERGWVWARVEIGGTPYTITSTHTEPDLAGNSLGWLRALQATELVHSVANDDRVIMLGDFNDHPASAMHHVVTGAGFGDVWSSLHPGADGLTCCHVADLSDQTGAFTQRIDYVFARGLSREEKLTGQIDRFGNVPADRLAGPDFPIWPSDHAGVIATLSLPK